MGERRSTQSPTPPKNPVPTCSSSSGVTNIYQEVPSELLFLDRLIFPVVILFVRSPRDCFLLFLDFSLCIITIFLPFFLYLSLSLSTKKARCPPNLVEVPRYQALPGGWRFQRISACDLVKHTQHIHKIYKVKCLNFINYSTCLFSYS